MYELGKTLTRPVQFPRRTRGMLRRLHMAFINGEQTPTHFERITTTLLHGRRDLPECLYEVDPDAMPAPFAMCFTPDALDALLGTVGRRYPESGAKGFGPMNGIGFDLVAFDERGSAAAQGTLYSPDVEWGDEQCAFHLDQPEPRLRLWTGDLHSHPGRYGRPSPEVGVGLGDLGYVRKVFELNEAMQWFLLPILTRTGPSSRQVVIHPWVVSRDNPTRPLLAPEVRVCPASEFPTREFNPRWVAGVSSEPAPDDDQVEREAPEILELQPATRALGVTAYPVPDTVLAGHTLSDTAALRDQLVKRLRGVVSPSFHERCVLVVGVGAGSLMVEKLARMSPREIRICDFDVIEVHNLARTAYTMEDALRERHKTEALAERLVAINPTVRVVSYQGSLTEAPPEQLEEMFDGVDLVVAGTDSFEAQRLINTMAVATGTPALFVGIFENAQGGRIVGTLPEHTGCYRCATPGRYAQAEQGQGAAATDLHGAHGSIADCQFIDMVALKLLVAMLERDTPSQAGRFFDHLGDRTEVQLRCDPEFEHYRGMWDDALGDLPDDQSGALHGLMLHAMDTVWLSNPPDAHCPDCGSPRVEETSTPQED